MGIPDRIILALYTVVMAVLSVLLILFTFNLLSVETATNFIRTIPGNWEIGIASLVVLLISIRLLIAGLGGTRGNIINVGSGADGRINVGQGAIEDFVNELCTEIFGVYDVKTVARAADKGINMDIRASIEPGTNIPETTEQIKKSVRKHVLETVGMEVKDINVFFKHIKAKAE